MQALLLPESRIARGPVGPGAIPIVVGSLLVVVAGVPGPRRLPRAVAASRRAARTSSSPGAATGRRSPCWSPAFVANALLIEPLGWPISGAILFFGSAFALGSRHYVRDAAIAAVLSFGSWYLFALGLGIILPVGILKGIL